MLNASKHKFLIYTILCLTFFSVYQTKGQINKINFQQIRNTGKTVRCIFKDSKGLMWFGTYTGLNKFDGTNLTNYEHLPSDSNSICHNSVNSIIEDKNGQIWIGTIEGLNYYDRLHDYFVDINTILPTGNRLNNNCITSLFTDNENNIWIGTLGGGINILNSKISGVEYFSLNDNNSTNPDKDYITFLCPENDERLWVGTRKGLFLIDIKKRAKIAYCDLKKSLNLENEYITYIEKANANTFWIATLNSGLIRLNRENNTYIINHFKTGKPDIGKSIRILCFDKNNCLWIGTENKGLIILNPESGEKNIFLPEEGNPNSIPSSSIWSIYIDNEEKVWIGTYNQGICLIDKHYDKFENYQRNPLSSNTLPDNDIRGFCQFTDEIILIATDGGGLCAFNTKSKIIKQIVLKKYQERERSNEAIMSILLDHEKNIWISIWGEGIKKLDKNWRETENFTLSTMGPGDNKISCLYEDSNKNLWAGSMGNGLFLFDKKAHKFIQITENKKGINIPTISYVTNMFEDSDHILWIGTLYGLFSLSLKKKDIYETGTYYKSNLPGSISSNRIVSIFEDSKKNLWFGTLDNGLNLYDKKNKKFKIFTKEDGFASNTINGILEDNSDQLWISSNNGITRFNPDNKESRVYTVDDGLGSNMFYQGAILSTSQGQFIFGSDNGFCSFNPDSILVNPTKPIMYFTDFKINNKSVKINQANSPLKKQISETSKIELNYDQTNFTIDFAGISYTRPNCNKYKYRMIGLDGKWNSIGNKTSVSFAGLNSGKYIFEVKGTNNDGIWSEKAIAITIVIHPPVWKTWWAYTFYILLITFIIAYFYRLRIERLKMLNSLKLERVKRESEQKLNQSKLQFFTNITHEFLTPLSLIIAPLESIINSVNINKEVKSKALSAYKSASQLHQLLDEFMDFRKVENDKIQLKVQRGDIIKLILGFKSSFLNTATKKNIEFNIITTKDKLDCWFDARIVEKVIRNLLSNSFKFTKENGKISVEISELNESQKVFAKIVVQDNGKGILQEDLPSIFDRFYQAKSDRNQGTGIGLALVKRWVEIHYGKIEVNSSQNSKTTFTVIIPISKESFSGNEIIESPIDIIDIKNEKNKSEIVQDSFTEEKQINRSEILIVEDYDDLRDYLAEELETSYVVLKARNGQEGLRIALETAPDLIVSDIMMPIMNGIELCRELKKNIKTSHIPIILLTAKTSVEEQIKGIESGADLYINKPFSIRFLNTQISQIIRSREILYKKFSQDVHIIPNQFAKNKIDEEFLAKVIEYITENITDSKLGVEYIADLVNLSRGQFYKKIKILTGQTAVEFVRSIRLKHAVKLMETRKYTLAEIAYLSGFTSPSYFTRSFKDYYGKAPSEYLNN